MASQQSLSGRRVVITGAGRGLGRALAIKSADLGADVVLLGRDRAALQVVGETIKPRTGRDGSRHRATWRNRTASAMPAARC